MAGGRSLPRAFPRGHPPPGPLQEPLVVDHLKLRRKVILHLQDGDIGARLESHAVGAELPEHGIAVGLDLIADVAGALHSCIVLRALAVGKAVGEALPKLGPERADALLYLRIAHVTLRSGSMFCVERRRE